MIARQEIDAKASQFEIHTTNVERDYVFGWLLHGLFTHSSLKDRLFLKGGNALRKGYFQNTRFSGDLDFGLLGDVPKDFLLSEINKVCDAVHERAGIDFTQADNAIKEKFAATEGSPLPDLKVYEVRVYFKDFYGKPGHMKIRVSMDFTRFDKVLLPIQTRPLIHPYSDADIISCEIRCMKLEEIVATKLKCLMQRQHAPDLFDYAYSIKLLGGTLNKDEVVRAFVQKTIFSKNPFILKSILLSTAFEYFREEWAASVVCAKAFYLQVEDAISTFVADLELLFAKYPDNGFARFVYYPAAQRAPIMHAARTQTLLRIRYKGEERLVGPYSLKYQVRRDGIEREYFFAHKVSGGSSAPGCKMFTADRMESIENTDLKFEPEYPIELSKAGEMPENRFLFDPNKPVRAPKARGRVGIFDVRSTRTSIKYKYKCGHCGKTFTKSKQSSSLGSHKAPGGWRCGGRSGYYVETVYP